ncbi:MAG: nucleoside hydrolase [Gemmatimonadota bacterium]|nr:nucleoside hydrolase [Gemmatimonadota bacterium]
MARRSRPTPPLRIVVDTDPGIDDALALLLALVSPELDVRAITTVYGNTTLSHATRNARAIARWADREVPIRAGAERPLRRPLEPAIETHGPSGLGEAVVPDEPAVDPAPLALLEVLAEQPGPVALVTLGPLTNLAHALAEDAELVHARVESHVAMGGSLGARGTATPLSEFNVWCDPEAAAIVLEAGLPSRWVGLDVTRRLYMTSADVEALHESPRRRWLRDALRQYVRFHRAYEQFDGCIINDPLVITELIRPGIVRFERVRVRIDPSDGIARGRTRVEADGVPAFFGTDVDAAAAHALLRERVFTRESGA